MTSFPVSRDHAADAAKLLRRLAVFMAAVVLPVTALFSRNAAAIFLPLVAALLTFGAFVDPEREAVRPRMQSGLASLLVLILIYFCLWLALSLAWTPFPASAAGRLGSSFAIAGVCAIALLGLPERMRASTLNLIPIGVFLSALALAGVAAAVAFEALPPALSVDRFVLERGMAAICLIAFVGAGWLLSRGRRIDAAALLVVVTAALAAQRSFPSGLAFAAGLLAFSVARVKPGLAALLIVAGVFASLAAAPLAPFAVKYADAAWLGWSDREAEALDKFGAVIASEWTRLATGHGFDTLRFAFRAGIIPAGLPRLPHLELWFEAGLPGILAAACAVVAAARWAVRAKAGVAAAATGVLAGSVTYAGLGYPFGYGVSQSWWLSTLAVAILLLACIARGQFRTTRPRAKLKPAA